MGALRRLFTSLQNNAIPTPKAIFRVNTTPVLVVLLLAFFPSYARQALAQGLSVSFEPARDEHYREELGVNQFTVPSIRGLFEDLQSLEPIPYAMLQQPEPEAASADRVSLALKFGRSLADGFIAVQAQDSDRVQSLSRLLIRYCNSMGIGHRIKPYSKSLLEKAYRKDWPGLKTDLAATQQDVEREMMRLRDEQIAHLISLGGWLRALEVGCQSVSASFTPERAAQLVRPELLDYFQERLSTLHPRVKQNPIAISLSTNLQQIRLLADWDSGEHLTPEKVAQILQITSALNLAIAQR